MHSLNARAQENVQDLLLMTHERIQEVIDIARERYDSLASLSDAIALLDMCHSFADNVASSRLSWCRPIVRDGSPMNQSQVETSKHSDQCINGQVIGDSRSLVIRNGRYAIDVSSMGLMTSEDGQSSDEFVPNDTYASDSQNFTIITGINGSGKSTYLKQIAIIVILAHCGCYIPAEEASIPICDRICSRIGTIDDQEHNISTFMQEMKETAYICKHASDKSLILIDELGRATSNEDGVAIAWAVAEFLLVKKTLTFFVTHYPQISKLSDVYPNVQNHHLGIFSAKGVNEFRYTHKIISGPCQVGSDYGVDMASVCGWPTEVVRDVSRVTTQVIIKIKCSNLRPYLFIYQARSIREYVEKKLPEGLICQNNSDSKNNKMVRHEAETILCNLSKHLSELKESEGLLNSDAKRAYLQVSYLQICSDANLFVNSHPKSHII